VAPPMKVAGDPVRVDDDDYLEIPTSLAGRAHPAVEPESQTFFDGLADGRIVLQHCDDCQRYTHFPVGGCMWCGSAAISHREVDGAATLYSFTVCYLSFGPGMEPPYVVGFVDLDCQPGLQMMTNIVGLRIADIRIGMPLAPHFVHDGDLSVVVYRPPQEVTS
jgi:uncharacterized OB-fold protein